MTRAIGNVAALHLAANAMLAGLGYYWLGTSESSAGPLAWSALVVVALVFLACWLNAGTLLYFREGRDGFARVLPRLFPVLALAAVLIAVYVLLARWDEYSVKPSAGTASWLTMNLRRPVKPAAMLAAFHAGLWLVRWVVVPVLALPLMADLAAEGWSGLRRFGRGARNWRYWLVTVILVWCAFVAPFKLLGWVPQVGSFGLEMASFTARLVAAYLLFQGGWLALLFFSQAKTAGKP